MNSFYENNRLKETLDRVSQDCVKETWKLNDDMGEHTLVLTDIGGDCWQVKAFHGGIFSTDGIIGPISKVILTKELTELGFKKLC